VPISGIRLSDEAHGVADTIIGNKVMLGETSDNAPGLAVPNGRLWLAWIGVDNHQLNVVGVTTMPDRSFGIDPALKQTMGESSDFAPALASFNGRLWIAWIGTGQRSAQRHGLTPR
jgi:hypothetical protein